VHIHISHFHSFPPVVMWVVLCYCLFSFIHFSSASGSDSGAYTVLTGTSPPPAVPDEFSRRFPLKSNDNHPVGSSFSSEGKKEAEEEGELVMRDMRSAAPRASVGGQWATFTGFDHRKEDEACIDFVFGRSDGVGWCVALRLLYTLTIGDSHGDAGRQRACLLRRRFRTMECSRVTIVSSLRMSSFLSGEHGASRGKGVLW
jgi:hypothetical protein